MTIGTVKKQYYHHNLFSFRRSVQDYKIQMDMEIVTFKYSECVCVCYCPSYPACKMRLFYTAVC